MTLKLTLTDDFGEVFWTLEDLQEFNLDKPIAREMLAAETIEAVEKAQRGETHET